MSAPTQATLSKTISPRGRAIPITNLIILALWLWLYRAVFDNLAVIFSRQEFRANQLALAGLLILIVARVNKAHFSEARLWPLLLNAGPHGYLPAAILAFGSTTAYLLAQRWGGLDTFSASLFGLASYGLVGLWVRPRAWRRGLPPCLLLIGVLPLGDYVQTFIGYPMRVLTAVIVSDVLALVSAEPVSVNTILVFENGVTQIDLPCSGAKSLWTGLLFLIAITWIEQRALNLRWLWIASTFSLLLFTANLARVGILIASGEVAGWRGFSKMIHVPLGVLGFVGACGAAVALLRAKTSQAEPKGALGRKLSAGKRGASAGAALPRPTWLAPLLGAIILSMGLISARGPIATQDTRPPAWKFSPDLTSAPLPYTAGELQAFNDIEPEAIDRRRFEYHQVPGSPIRGTLLLITTRSWRAHHQPERCFEVLGLQTISSHTHLVNPNFPLRYLSLTHAEGGAALSAVYWFQSFEATTEDFSARVWADLLSGRKRWVLVTVLFDDRYDPHLPALQALFSTLHADIQRGLEGGMSP